MPSDVDLHQHINELIETERELRRKLAAGEIDGDTEHAELTRAETQLDQLWDLLRQRQALREYGESADRARIRGAEEVEGYLS